MVAIQGISGVPEPKPERPSKVRESKEQPVMTNKAKDGVVISNEAQAAAQLARLVKAANEGEDVRVDKVEAARERLARGDYKNPEVVSKVAEKLIRYLP